MSSHPAVFCSPSLSTGHSPAATLGSSPPIQLQPLPSAWNFPHFYSCPLPDNAYADITFQLGPGLLREAASTTLPAPTRPLSGQVSLGSQLRSPSVTSVWIQLRVPEWTLSSGSTGLPLSPLGPRDSSLEGSANVEPRRTCGTCNTEEHTVYTLL